MLWKLTGDSKSYESPVKPFNGGGGENPEEKQSARTSTPHFLGFSRSAPPEPRLIAEN